MFLRHWLVRFIVLHVMRFSLLGKFATVDIYIYIYMQSLVVSRDFDSISTLALFQKVLV